MAGEGRALFAFDPGCGWGGRYNDPVLPREQNQEVFPLAACLRLAENSRLGFRTVASTSRWGTSFSISSSTLGFRASLYDGRIGSRTTGKERDTESGNDYFGARYYASSMGRWLSPDPLYLELHRLTDPQQLNLYSYVRNNPLSLTDPDGHDIAVKCEDKANCTTATNQVNERKDGQFKVEIGKDGKWHPVGNVDASKLSGAEKAFYGALTDTNTHATLTAVSGDGGVFFGLSTGKGSNTVDVADTAQLASAGLSPGSAVAHEAMEAYATAGGASLSDAHNNDPFPGFTLLGAGGIPQVNNGNLTGYQYNLRYNGPGGGNYQVNTTLKTPIPVASFTNPQTRPAAVQQRNTSEMVTGVTPK